MPENLFPGAEAENPERDPPDDAPTGRFELRITLTNGGVDEIGAGDSAHLGGYLRALANHGLISPAEHNHQVDALQIQILQQHPSFVTLPTRTNP